MGLGLGLGSGLRSGLGVGLGSELGFVVAERAGAAVGRAPDQPLRVGAGDLGGRHLGFVEQ